MDRRLDRRHLQLDGMQSQLLDGPRATDAAIADKAGRLLVPLLAA
jgi:hypothetical protein